jgi:hypothetical protein
VNAKALAMIAREAHHGPIAGDEGGIDFMAIAGQRR